VAVGEMGSDSAGKVMDAVRSTLRANPTIAVGLIVDEVQTITVAIRDGMPEPATTAPRVGAEYFKQWHNWDNDNNVFVRMDIASSHGARELKLPSGEEHRLRVVQPWTADLVTAATTSPSSPCAFTSAHERARLRIVFSAGGIPRCLFRGRKLLLKGLAKGLSLEKATAAAEDSLRGAMEENCSRWFAALTKKEKRAAASDMLHLIRGEVRWDRVKGLYDEGIVARCSDSSHVMPVSAVASSVIMAELAPYFREHLFKSLASVPTGAPRGYELEMQVITLLAEEGGNQSLPAKKLKGNESAPKVPAHVDERLPFGTIADIELHPDLARLYVPTSTEFACDAITVPPVTAAASEPIVVWETSVTSPRDAERVDKVLKWFRKADAATKVSAGIILQLRAAHPKRPIVCALCWPDHLLGAGTATKHAELTAEAAGVKDVRVAVVDIEGLQALGVLA